MQRLKNAGDQREVDRAQERKLAAEREDLVVLRQLVSYAAGRGFVWRLLESCGVWRQSLVLSPEGYANTAFNEGKRSVGQKLLFDLTTNFPEAYLLMIREFSGVTLKDEINEREQRLDDERNDSYYSGGNGLDPEG